MCSVVIFLNLNLIYGELFYLLTISTQTPLSFEWSNRRRKVEDDEQGGFRRSKQIQLFFEVVSSETPPLYSSCLSSSLQDHSQSMDGWTDGLKGLHTQMKR